MPKMIAKITRAGQMSVPAAVRARWATDRVSVEDRGDHIVVRPLPSDPVAAFRGAFRGGRSSDELRELARRDEAAAERPRR